MKVLAAGLDDITLMFLRESGIAVAVQDVENAADLKTWLVDGIYDAAVFDIEKSNLGIYAARGVRAMRLHTPLIAISAGSSERVRGDHRALFLENGGDDLLRGPVNPRELVASLRAVTRRFKGALLDIVEYQNGGAKLKINLTTQSVLINGSPVTLTGKERAMVLLFASSPGRVLSKEFILTQMYTDGVDDEPEMKIIDVFICKLRRKLVEAHPDAEKFLETVWGRGYRLPEQSEMAASTEKAA